ncbi:MAG: ABC transporter permease subunit [Xanthomonadaceae bacterium]|nr:ABC transporter permease subunit [Xanthomonadaceae bacterium]
MKKVWTIATKDFRSYFTSPIAYIVIAGFLTIMGWMFFFNLSHFNSMNLQYRSYGMGKSVSISEGIIRPLYGNMNVILLFLTPFITMRLFSEEKKLHTIELLMTSPVTLMETILGKFLSAFLLVLVMVGITFTYPVILFLTGNPDIGVVFTSILGTLLLSGCYLSIGILFSAMTENQIVAGALTFASGLFLWLISWASQSTGPVMGEFLNYLSLIGHYNNFSQGMIQSGDVIFYVSFIGLGLFFTHQVLDSYRWR